MHFFDVLFVTVIFSAQHNSKTELKRSGWRGTSINNTSGMDSSSFLCAIKTCSSSPLWVLAAIHIGRSVPSCSRRFFPNVIMLSVISMSNLTEPVMWTFSSWIPRAIKRFASSWYWQQIWVKFFANKLKMGWIFCTRDKIFGINGRLIPRSEYHV